MMEYIKLFWEDAPEGEPSVILYEVDTENERLALHSIDIFADGRTRNIPDLYDGAIEITPIPTVEELNAHVWGEEFHACVIEQAEFEAAWESHTYDGALKSPGGDTMNEPIKAKNLPLFSIIDLDQLRREKHLEGTEVTDFFTARDGKVYLLMEQPSETQGKDWLSTPSTYTAVEIQLDWAEQRVLETTLFPLGLLKFQFHYLRPAGDHFLLLGARCAYRENGPDQNAWIVSQDGAVLSRFCLGDGIQDCVVKKDGTIITSYFDEGVFGNYGWDEPLGACGLIAWTSEGTPLWKNENYSIYDCYAISLDEEENLWFYYYDEFRLVRTNFKEDFVFELPIEGSGAFSVAPSGNTFLFQGGYQQRDKFYFLTAHGDHLGKKQEAIPTCDGNKVAVEQCSLLRSRMLFLGKDGVLYGGIWGSDGQ